MIKLKSILLEDITDTPEFKRWFGDSKVVDAAGNPLVVYHGGTKGVTIFDTNRVTTRNPKGDIAGTYFTNDYSTAIQYIRRKGEPRGDITPAYLSIRNPLDITDAIKKFIKRGMSFGDAKRESQKYLNDKHDGIIFRGDKNNSAEYVVFDPRQIKSATGNNGNFDPNDPDITKENL